TAGRADRRNFYQAVGPNRRRIGAVGNRQTRVVEGRLLPPHALVGQREQERHEVFLIVLRQTERPNQRRERRVREVAALVAELERLREARFAAVVEIGAVQLDVAQRQHFESARGVGVFGFLQTAGQQRKSRCVVEDRRATAEAVARHLDEAWI